MKHNINLYSLPNYYSLGSIRNHYLFKEKLLEQIKNTPSEKYANITRCDWSLPKNVNRVYKNTLIEIINPYLINLSKLINATEFKVQNYWFQQYEDGSEHDWHIHPAANYTGVYYVEYPDLKAKTQLYDFINKKIIQLKTIKEGDVFIFPSNYVHKAPKIKNNKRKTIISFNMDFTVFDIDKIKKNIKK